MNQTIIEQPEDTAKQAQKDTGLTLLTFVLLVALFTGLIRWKSADPVDATTCATPRATAGITPAK